MKKLATIDVGEGREAAIVERDDGTTSWTPGVERWVTVDPPPSVVEVPAGTLVAGEMPPGSQSVEVRAEAEPLETVVAGGHFLALLPGKLVNRDVFALFRDARGEIMAPARV